MIPKTAWLKNNGKLHIGRKKLNISGVDWDYEGDLDEDGKASGHGVASGSGAKWEGIFFNDELILGKKPTIF